MVEIRVQAKSLQERRENWRKTVNFNVMDMIDRVESKETALKQMLSTVKKDRTKIESTIEKLNDYMLETLHSTWEKVNKYPPKHLVRLTLVEILERYLVCYCPEARPNWTAWMASR